MAMHLCWLAGGHHLVVPPMCLVMMLTPLIFVNCNLVFKGNLTCTIYSNEVSICVIGVDHTDCQPNCQVEW